MLIAAISEPIGDRFVPLDVPGDLRRHGLDVQATVRLFNYLVLPSGPATAVFVFPN